jgi:hypothetical protein
VDRHTHFRGQRRQEEVFLLKDVLWRCLCRSAEDLFTEIIVCPCSINFRKTTIVGAWSRLETLNLHWLDVGFGKDAGEKGKKELAWEFKLHIEVWGFWIYIRIEGNLPLTLPPGPIGYTWKQYLTPYTQIFVSTLLTCGIMRVWSGGRCCIFIRICSMIWKILFTTPKPSMNSPGNFAKQTKFSAIFSTAYRFPDTENMV